MNKSYHVVWNDALGAFVVVPETAKGKTKSSSIKKMSAALLSATAMFSISAMATDAVIQPTWSAALNNNEVGALTFDTAGDHTLTGSTSFKKGSGGSSGMTIVDAMALGYVTGPDLTGKQQIIVGNKGETVAIPDPITGNLVSVSVYSPASFFQGALGTTFDGSNTANTISLYLPDSSPYVDLRLATVTNGKLKIDLSDSSLSLAAVKQSSLVKVDGTKNAAEAVWSSPNLVNFGASYAITAAATATNPYNKTIQSFVYAGTFSVTDSKGTVTSHTVTDLATLNQYNSWLVTELKAGRISYDNYDASVSKAYVTTNIVIRVRPTGSDVPLPASDTLFLDVGTRTLMEATGAQAIARVANPAGTSMGIEQGTLLTGTLGGTVINDGRIAQTADQGVAFNISSGAQGINNGVLTSGYLSTNSTASPDDNARVYVGGNNIITGTGTKFTNNGIVNIGAINQDTRAMVNYWSFDVKSSASFLNNGVMNIGINNSNLYTPVVGAQVSTLAKIINAATGVMYLGRGASGQLPTGTLASSLASGGADTAISAGASAIQVINNGQVDNLGQIIIGSGMQNSTAIKVTGNGAAANVVNHGVITINGAVKGSPLQNAGILVNGATGASVIDNAGTINLNGVNGVGVKVTGGGKATSSGQINVAQSPDPLLANYGLWAEGIGSTVTLKGAVNLIADGAIGLIARNLGTITIAGDGAVNFSSGKKQIGYFAYGPGAVISNSGTGAQDVSTEGSVLYRMEAGADFTGGAGSTSSLTASGINSTAVVVTGLTDNDVSAFNSGGMTLNLTGKGATGVLVEGGAQGKIASNATIQLSGEGAIAGIADGKAHLLDGSVDGLPFPGSFNDIGKAAGDASFGTGTLLLAAANLNSSLDGVTGYIAKNGAAVNNSGNIVFTGAKTTGVQVLEGSTGTNSGSITVQDGGTGLTASSTSSATALKSSGNLVLKGGSNANRTTGISATGQAVTVDMTAGKIDMQGQGAIGVAVHDGATVNLSGTALPVFSTTSSVTDQIAFLVGGAGSNINTDIPQGTVLDSSGTNSTLFRLESGAKQSGVLKMKTSGTGARGIWATGEGTTVTAASGSDFKVLGDNAMSILVQGGAQATLEQGTTVSLLGNGSIAGQVDGNEYAIDGTTILRSNAGTKLTNNAALTTTLSNANGFITQNQGLLVNNGTIDMTSGTNNTGVLIKDGQFENHSNISVNGVAVAVEGASSKVDVQAGLIKATGGTAAIKIGKDASLDLVGSGLGKVTAGGTAHAVLLDTGAKGLVVDGAYIDMASLGAGSGNGIENKAEISGIQLTNTTTIDVMNGKGVRTAASLAKTNAGTINVKGAGTGLAFETATGTAMSNNIDFSTSNGLTVNVNGAKGTGISVKHTGGGDVKNGANVTVAAGGGSAVTLSGVSTFSNTGNLISSSVDAALIALGETKSVINTGVIKAASAVSTALGFDAQDSSLTNDGEIVGMVDLGAGTNTATNGAEGKITGNIVSTTGNNTITNNGTVTGSIALDSGNNTITNGGDITGNIGVGAGTNTIINTKKITGSIGTGAGKNTITNNGTITGNIVVGAGTNSITLGDGSSVSNVLGGAGVNAVTVKGSAAFTSLDGGIGGGDDTLTFDGATTTLSAAHTVDHFESMMLRNNSTVTTAGLLKMTDTAGGVGVIDIDSSSTLALNPLAGSGYTLAHTLKGSGMIDAAMGAAGDAFNFAASAGTAFAGTVKAGLGTFALGDKNTAALTNAKLIVDAGNVTTVSAGDQNIGGIAFNGGTVKFDATVPNQKVATSHIVATNLDAGGNGTIQVNVPTQYLVPAVVPANTMNLLEQDDVNDGVQLIAGGKVVGTGGALVLVDQNGKVITNANTIDLTQSGNKVAVATYDYGVNTGVNSNGLYVGYRLKQLDLQAGQHLTLNEGTATGAASDMSAKITGSGNLDIGATGTIALSNLTNDYTGETSVNTGTLRLANDNVLGSTSKLNIASQAKVDAGGKTHTIGALAGQKGSVLDLNGGSLTLTNGGVSDGTLTGTGSFKLAAGDLTVAGANTGFKAAITIANGAHATLNNAAGLGSEAITDDGSLTLDGVKGTLPNKLLGAGQVILKNTSDLVLGTDNTVFKGEYAIDTSSTLTASVPKSLGAASVQNEGMLVLNSATDWNLANVVQGDGSLTKNGSGTVTMGSGVAYTGTTQVNMGSLLLGSESAPVNLASSQVNIASGAQFGGYGGVAGSIDNSGTLKVGDSSSQGQTFTIGGNLANNGLVQLAGSTLGNTLDIKGDLSGNGQFAMKTQAGTLEGDLIKVGGDTSGQHQLRVNDTGYEPVSADGKLTLVETHGGSGTFNLAGGYVDAGTFRYRLAQEDNNWVLSTSAKPVDPVNPVDPVTPVDPVVPVDPVTPVDPVKPVDPVVPPTPVSPPKPADLSKGANAAVAAQTASASLWSAQMNAMIKRMGELRMGKDEGGIWTRAIGKRFEVAENSSRAYDQNINGMEIGADKAIMFSSGKVYIGGMVGTAHSDANFGEGASGDVDSKFGGVYATYLHDNGVYVDTVAKYSRFDNKIKTPTNTGEQVKGSYNTNGVGIDLEVGKHIRLKNGWFVEPQLEITATKTEGARYTASNGLNVKADDMDSLQSRVGGLVGRSIEMSNGMKVQPYAKASYVTEHYGDSTVKVNGIKLDAKLPGNRTEVGLGGVVQVTENSKISLDAEVAKGNDIKQPFGVTLGYRYLW